MIKRGDTILIENGQGVAVDGIVLAVERTAGRAGAAPEYGIQFEIVSVDGWATGKIARWEQRLDGGRIMAVNDKSWEE